MINQTESLDCFIYNEIERIKTFRKWYQLQHTEKPTEYPIELPLCNAGVWDEMLADFNQNDGEV